MEELDSELWATDAMRAWKEEDIKKLLDLAESCLTEACANLRLDVQYLRKSKAVGCFPKQVGDRIAYEALEDVAMAVHVSAVLRT